MSCCNDAIVTSQGKRVALLGRNAIALNGEERSSRSLTFPSQTHLVYVFDKSAQPPKLWWPLWPSPPAVLVAFPHSDAALAQRPGKRGREVTQSDWAELREIISKAFNCL